LKQQFIAGTLKSSNFFKNPKVRLFAKIFGFLPGSTQRNKQTNTPPHYNLGYLIKLRENHSAFIRTFFVMTE